MRLIDAENLDEKAVEFPNTSIWVPIEAVWDEPPIDAVPVVRCKDCDHMEIRFNARFCKVWCMFNGFGDNGFCNYGYPKDGAADEIR